MLPKSKFRHRASVNESPRRTSMPDRSATSPPRTMQAVQDTPLPRISPHPRHVSSAPRSSAPRPMRPSHPGAAQMPMLRNHSGDTSAPGRFCRAAAAPTAACSRLCVSTSASRSCSALVLGILSEPVLSDAGLMFVIEFCLERLNIPGLRGIVCGVGCGGAICRCGICRCCGGAAIGVGAACTTGMTGTLTWSCWPGTTPGGTVTSTRWFATFT
mmetsp:Transcript_12508/g.31706  ORF Transcript_12508/g.31706 Transcript_12508/m.31706 type:complete len:214 (+) Transcript_12508:328-969(+)